MTMTADAKAGAKPRHVPPFDAARLDRLLEEEKIDTVVVCSKHNIQYLLGGYRFFFFDYFDAVGPSRYLPLLIYQKGHPERSTYLGYHTERYEAELGRFWVPRVETRTRGTVASMSLAVEHLKSLGKIERIGVERAFLPADAEQVLRDGMPGAAIVEAWSPLERLRAVKTPDELILVREASERVVDSMLTVMSAHGPGATKQRLVQALKEEEVRRGLNFEYCFVTVGSSLNRAPSDQVWGAGEILSLDSGGNYQGYIGDLCRMAIHGEPDQELVQLLGEVDEIQQAARKATKAGATGADIYGSAAPLVQRSPNAKSIEFVAHGLGLVPNESPRLTYTRQDMDKPLEAGMVLSIETILEHPRRGFIKLEDTVAVTKSGLDGLGDKGRGWNRGGSRANNP